MAKEDILKTTLKEYGDHISQLLNAVANTNRVQITSLLLEDKMEFSKLQDITGLSKTALSHHLKILEKSGIISNPARGQYEITGDGIALLTSIGDSYIKTKWREEEESRRRVEQFSNAYRRRKGMEVKIVELEPMRVASFRALSETPEHDAAQMLATWAQERGYMDDLEKNPVFGFNNPNPSEGKKEYGYEFLVKVSDKFDEEGVNIKDVEGGRYAVTTCESLNIIGEKWMQLVEWLKKSEYQFRDADCLEKTHDFGASDEDLVLDLYLPIKGKSKNSFFKNVTPLGSSIEG